MGRAHTEGDDEVAMDNVFAVKLLSENARLPRRASPYSAGLDLMSAQDVVVPAHGSVVVNTDLSIRCPVGTYARIAPRSGLAARNMIDCLAGVVDADYRGNVGVVLINHGGADFEVGAGDRIAQMILEKVSFALATEVHELDGTVRGSGGFGSTGSCGDSQKRARSPRDDGGRRERRKMIVGALGAAASLCS